MLSGAAGPAIQMADRELKYDHDSTAEVSVSAIFVLKIVTHYVATPLVGSWHSRIGGSHQPRPAAVTALSHQDSGGMAAYARRSRCGKEGLGSGAAAREENERMSTAVCTVQRRRRRRSCSTEPTDSNSLFDDDTQFAVSVRVPPSAVA